MSSQLFHPTLRYFLGITILCCALANHASANLLLTPRNFSGIKNWTGAGKNTAALVIDWADGTSLIWGYHWNGAATGQQMLYAIIAADPHLYLEQSAPNPTYGVFPYGFGYQAAGDGNFDLSPPLTFTNQIATLSDDNDVDSSRTAVDPSDQWEEGWLSGGYWAYWNYNFTSDGWRFGDNGMTFRTLSNDDIDGWSWQPEFNGNTPADPTNAFELPEPATIALTAFCVALTATRRRRKALVIAAAAAISIGLGAQSAQAAYVPNPTDFATQVISYANLSSSTTYDNPQAILGPPTLMFNDGTPADPVYHRSKIIEAPYNTDTSDNNTLAVMPPSTASVPSFITVEMGRPVYHDPGNQYGIDLIVYGNSFFGGSGGLVSDNTNLNTFTLNGSELAHQVIVSVSPDDVNWYTYPAVAPLPFNAYQWNDAPAGWTNNINDFNEPVNPALDSMTFSGVTAAHVSDLYAGAAGGIGFDISQTPFSFIQFVRVQSTTTDEAVIDSIAAVDPVPEPARAAIGAAAALLLNCRHRS
jgi:hypothetical protein